MHKNILIVGAGFSGMWAALSAARLVDKYQSEDIKITVIAPQPNYACVLVFMKTRWQHWLRRFSRCLISPA